MPLDGFDATNYGSTFQLLGLWLFCSVKESTPYVTCTVVVFAYEVLVYDLQIAADFVSRFVKVFCPGVSV